MNVPSRSGIVYIYIFIYYILRSIYINAFAPNRAIKAFGSASAGQVVATQFDLTPSQSAMVHFIKSVHIGHPMPKSIGDDPKRNQSVEELSVGVITDFSIPEVKRLAWHGHSKIYINTYVPISL